MAHELIVRAQTWPRVSGTVAKNNCDLRSVWHIQINWQWSSPGGSPWPVARLKCNKKRISPCLADRSAKRFASPQLPASSLALERPNGGS